MSKKIVIKSKNYSIEIYNQEVDYDVEDEIYYAHQVWKFREQIHRNDEPAVIYDDGFRYWYKYGIEAGYNSGRH